MANFAAHREDLDVINEAHKMELEAWRNAGYADGLAAAVRVVEARRPLCKVPGSASLSDMERAYVTGASDTLVNVLADLRNGRQKRA